ncbi:hypothetical protein SALB_02332 [Streptomyces noursei]|uniref:Uncharacterized protein n=1 Tax=Streptomyces noursei TaxID=1971 RepID=A0A401QW76_STRNR|nr:hypothetical protein SALB_02332 [Streptomyces noursei]
MTDRPAPGPDRRTARARRRYRRSRPRCCGGARPMEAPAGAGRRAGIGWM